MPAAVIVKEVDLVHQYVHEHPAMALIVDAPLCEVGEEEPNLRLREHAAHLLLLPDVALYHRPLVALLAYLGEDDIRLLPKLKRPQKILDGPVYLGELLVEVL